MGAEAERLNIREEAERLGIPWEHRDPSHVIADISAAKQCYESLAVYGRVVRLEEDSEDAVAVLEAWAAQQYGQLFAAAPDLIAALRRLVEDHERRKLKGCEVDAAEAEAVAVAREALGKAAFGIGSIRLRWG